MEKEFTIIIEETISQEFKVVANTMEDAIKIGIKNYKDNLFIVEDASLSETKIGILETNGEFCWSKL